MLCVPRSSSPTHAGPPTVTKGSPTSPGKSKLFARKDASSSVPTTPKSPTTRCGMSSPASVSGAVAADASGVNGGLPAIAASPVSVSRRTGSRWLDFVVRKDTKVARATTKSVADADAPSSPRAPSAVETIHSGTTGHTNSGSRDITEPPPSISKSTFTSILGLGRRPRDDSIPKIVSRPTPSPMPLSQLGDSESEDDVDDGDEFDDEDSDDAAHSMNSTTDVHPLPPQPQAPPPSAFYAPKRSPSAYPLPDPPRHYHNQPQQPLRSHTNLLLLTTSSLQSIPSPHPLITPRSAAGNAAPPSSAQLFPRSSNLVQLLPRSRSVFTTLHKTRIIRRLESPGSLTASEELSILSFATRTPGSRMDRSGPSSSIYPSSSYRHSSSRTSLMRNLSIEDGGDLMREVDVNAQVQGQGYPTSSKGLKRWLSRPSFEQRAVMWVPVVGSYGDAGVVRSAVHRPALKGPASLEFSEGLEALAGVVRPRASVAWRTRSCATITQVVAPLYHPKPRAVTSVALRSVKQPDGLLIPTPPQLSSSPSSSASTDTAPNTPPNSSSGQNLSSFVPPAFLRKLRQNNTYNGLDVSDEDDVPLGVVVITKRAATDVVARPSLSPKKDDHAEKIRRARDKAVEKQKRKAAHEASAKKSYKEQVLASRMRRELYRATGRAPSLSDEWIEVDSPSEPKREDGASSSERRPSQYRRSLTAPNPPFAGPSGSSTPSIRSQSSAKSRPNSLRPPSIAGSDRSRHSISSPYPGFQPGMHPPNMMMAQPTMAYPMAANMAAFGNGTNQGVVPNFVQYPPTFFVPPPPPHPAPRVGSRRDSVGSMGEQGYPQGVQQQAPHRSMPSRSRTSSQSRPGQTQNPQSYSLPRAPSRQHQQLLSPQHLVPPQRRASIGVSSTSSDNDPASSTRNSRTTTNTTRRSPSARSVTMAPPRMGFEIS